jgi:DNA replicative helicase MCM subunit Mcm2 (Cdc46/Mcm family)
MASAENTELVDSFEQFYRNYYDDEIKRLAQRYPNEERSLNVDWGDLYRHDPDLADDYLTQPEQLREYAEEALRLYDLPIDVSLGQAHVRIRNLPETTGIRDIRSRHVNTLVSVTGIVRKATNVQPKIEEAAFECQRCGTLTRIPQESGSFQEPHECQGCERQGPFQINFDQSEFVDAQKLRVQESPEGLRGGETPQSLDVHIEDDITGEVSPGDHVTATGTLRLEQQGSQGEKSPLFDVYMDGVSVELEDEEFEDMEITEGDKQAIVELSRDESIYQQMVDSIAPSIYGYEEEKLAIILQLFSGVRKNLPEGSRVRGDLHILLIGDPGTGKCVDGDTRVTLSDGSEVVIRNLVERNLEDPISVDDGYYQEVDFEVPSLNPDGSVTQKRATKVWKREAPDRMYRVRTESGMELEVTPSHPLFVPEDGGFAPKRADELTEGEFVATAPSFDAVPDGGTTGDAGFRVGRSTDDALAVEDDVRNLRQLAESDVHWDRIESIDMVDPDEEWVYDLEVEDTHNYVSNDVISHNSQLLQYIRNIAPRSVYTSGKGSSAAGLTASAVRDDFGDGQQWTLEAGALVLADQGIAAVDELDKMRCVTGDTVVRTSEGGREIRTIAANADEATDVEMHDNGRTVRGIDVDVWTMTEDDRLVQRPVTAVHEYDAPERLYEISLASGDALTTTPDHPFFVRSAGDRVERPAADIEEGDLVYVPEKGSPVRPDGAGEVSPRNATERRPSDVTVERVDSVHTVSDHEYENVFDLTVAGTHNFVANGTIVHNSEDRSAMHEALEQQSYHPDQELLLADGRRVEIGEFVDDAMANNPDDVVDGVDCEILPLDDVRVHSADVEAGEVTKLPVDRVSRHEAPDEFVRITFSNGREVTVTPEHPMFVGTRAIETIPANEIEEGAFVPAPRKLPNSTAAVDLADEPHRGTEKDVRLPKELTPDLAEILGFLAAEGHSYAGSAHEIGFSNGDDRLLDRMDALMDRVFGMESTDTTSHDGTVTKRWVSTKLYRWFERNVPEVMGTARQKRIPATVLAASEEGIRRFLVGAFAGDGGVESEAMAFSTASHGLAEDYADALGKIGVAARIHYSKTEDSWKTYVMGDSTKRFVDRVVNPDDDRFEKAVGFADRSTETPRHHDVLPTGVATTIRDLKRSLGLPLTGRLTTNLQEGYGVQRETVEDELETIRDRVEEVRDDAEGSETIGTLREAVGWSCRQLADRLDGETTSSISYAENGGYDPEKREEMADRARVAIESTLREAGETIDRLENLLSFRYYRVADVETVPNDGGEACEWVYDVAVEPANTFVSKGVVLHNSVSISKAGINATLKSRCSLLGAANPKYGRFDEYEPIAEQIDLEPALISRFDLIFTVTDKPDEEEDKRLAEHILTTNYAGELNTQRTEMASPDVTQEEVDAVTEEVEPTIEAELLRKYVAYAKQNCHPRMTDAAQEAIRDFYVDLRAQGQGEDSPVPVTARKLEALVRLAEASARVRLSDTVDEADAERVIDIVQSSLQDIGVDPETGELDADFVETGTTKSQRDRIKNLKGLIREIQDEYDDGAPVDVILERTDEIGMDETKVEHEIEKMKQKGELYEPNTGTLRLT